MSVLVYTIYCVSSGLIIACEYFILHTLVFEIVIVGDKLPYLDRNELYYIYATRELVRPSAITRVISAFCIGTNTDVLQDQPCPCALEQAPLFSFYSSNRKHIIYFQPCLFSCWIFCRLFIFSIFTIIVCR